MSLVNDMLRDLERRNERSTAAANQQGVKAAQPIEPPAPNPLPRLILWGIGLLAICTTGWLLWQEYALADNNRALPVAAVAPAPAVQPEPVVIEQIQWAGSDQAGDLVVRLNGAADIQLLNQSATEIEVAFEDVALNTPLPVISSQLVADLQIRSLDQRQILTLSTRRGSQFSFKVQHNPSTLILGVIPAVAEEASVPSDPVVMEKPDSEVAKPVAVQKETLRNGAALQVQSEAEPIKRTPQPVSKSIQQLSDAKVAQRARSLVNKGQLEQAEAFLWQEIRKQPKQMLAARVLLITLQLSAGDTAAAQALLDRSLPRHPEDAALKKLQARLWISQGQPAQAQALLMPNRPGLKADPEYHELLASAYQQQGAYESAARVYYQLLQQNNQVPRWWIGMGYALEQAQRYAEARNAYQSGLQIPMMAQNLKNYARQRLQALAGR
ncbi:tetratricopeptide repeat protein [Neptuniibacter halophilus]|uniref:tetratricopeptide repeat protein n=1 Tax=Neptuniibacter halophilus TaxID=651666 RepID=UPI002573A4E5|nr:tetratricopeptide repeat protein [Neptuniibacter halophilus]